MNWVRCSGWTWSDLISGSRGSRRSSSICIVCTISLSLWIFVDITAALSPNLRECMYQLTLQDLNINFLISNLIFTKLPISQRIKSTCLISQQLPYYDLNIMNFAQQRPGPRKDIIKNLMSLQSNQNYDYRNSTNL